ncbi:triose-phosphate isomerase [Gryllotalpicola ginsengisoli]|uniref:triose-phosphate isomerase n=1 Tax=Gryllotalpicola ginsengisoli TaxID=444608 RepID=UPI0003B68953|nr:triose-phosphate isomerase [Gryllotalpicola ginsengisoli]
MTEAQRTPLIAGNWKMNFDHLQAIAFVQKLAWMLGDAKHDFDDVEVAVFPPFTDLRSVQTLVQADKLPIAYGGQDLSTHALGAYTGEISGRFLKKLDCTYCIVGHSERRYRHVESDETVAAKTKAALEAELVPLICVGETAKDLERHEPSAVPANQLRGALLDVKPGTDFVVAYEPVWAIGSGAPATPEQAQNVASVLRRVIAQSLDEETAAKTRILYGGSVKPDNIVGFMKCPDIDGALVGTASLDVDAFASIVRYKKHATY